MNRLLFLCVAALLSGCGPRYDLCDWDQGWTTVEIDRSEGAALGSAITGTGFSRTTRRSALSSAREQCMAIVLDPTTVSFHANTHLTNKSSVHVFTGSRWRRLEVWKHNDKPTRDLVGRYVAQSDEIALPLPCQ